MGGYEVGDISKIAIQEFTYRWNANITRTEYIPVSVPMSKRWAIRMLRVEVCVIGMCMYVQPLDS